jgi:hypothetical protein
MRCPIRPALALAEPVEEIKLGVAGPVPLAISRHCCASSIARLVAVARGGRDFLSGVLVWGDSRQRLEPPAQIIGEHERSAATLHSTKLTSANRLIDCRSAGARGIARLTNREGKRF